MATEYNGPSVATMIKSHTLAAEIIDRAGAHDDNSSILDPSELLLLRRFCADPSPSTKDAILRERDMVDEPGDRPGTRANRKYGSLAGYAVATYGTENSALEEREVEMLRRWFESGGGGGAVDARIAGVDNTSTS